MSRRAAAPLLLNSSLILGSVVLSWRKLASWHGAEWLLGAVVAFAYVSWAIWELRISLRDSRKQSVRSDRSTLELYALSQGGTALAALGFETRWPFPSLAWALVGALTFGAGLLVRAWAVRELGQFYSHRVQITQAHQLVESGPYRWLRHPAYSGMFLAHLGLVWVFFNWVSALLLLLAMTPALMNRIFVEERALAALPGYAAFCRDRARLIPLVW